jgi:hypothetical protein
MHVWNVQNGHMPSLCNKRFLEMVMQLGASRSMAWDQDGMLALNRGGMPYNRFCSKSDISGPGLQPEALGLID